MGGTASLEAVDFVLQARDAFSQVFNKAETGLARLEKSYGSLQKVIAGGLAAEFFTEMIREGQQAEIQSNRLTAVLRATGESAGVSKRELDELAESLSRVTQFEAEAIRSGEATLLKFGNIRGSVLAEAVKLSADVAAFLGEDFASGAQMVGKSLQSPTEGLRAMEREFGKLSPAQKRSIELFMQQGKLLEAQNVVLQIYRDKIGGAAQEMNTGWLKVLSDIKKGLVELFEVISKSVVGDVTKKAFGFIADGLHGIKAVVESGDWLKNLSMFLNMFTLSGTAVNVLQLGMGAGAGGSRVSSGKIGGLPAGGRAGGGPTKEQLEFAKRRDELYERMMTGGLDYRTAGRLASGAAGMDQNTQAYRDQLKTIELLIRAEKSRADAMEGEEKQLEWRSALERELNLARVEERKKADEEIKKGDAESWEAYIQGINDSMDVAALAEADRVHKHLEFMEELQTLSNEQRQHLGQTNDAARQLGLTFSSAFETMLIKGASVRQLMQGLLQDVLQIAARKTITEPLAAGLTMAFGAAFRPGPSDVAGSTALADAISGQGQDAYRAQAKVPSYDVGTDFVPRDQLAFVHQGERIIPAGQNGGGGVVFNQSFSVGGNVSREELANVAAAAQQGAMEGIQRMARNSVAVNRTFK